MTATSPRARFRPLLKWPGGKTREWPTLAPFVPTEIRHFVDPFMGGLAPFARTEHTGRAFLNDRHPLLVDVHRRVKSADESFLDACDALACGWQALATATEALLPPFRLAVEGARSGARPTAAAFEAACGVACPADQLAGYISKSLADKSRRVAALEKRHERRFSDEELDRHGETAVRAGFYTLVRDRLRGAAVGPQSSADFLFVRETCYGSMFRTNAKGEFNIPYGGASYNRKSFATRVAQLREPATVAALDRAEFSCDDFDEFLGRVVPQIDERDFVFLDPPYDSDFSTYGGNAFGLDDHERLARAAAALPSRWLLVIKETPDVERIYVEGEPGRAGARVALRFGKRYGYNVRGRNERSVRHLILVGGSASEPERHLRRE